MEPFSIAPSSPRELTPQPQQRSSMRTMFEFRSRRWLVVSIVSLALAWTGYAIAKLIIFR